MEKQDITNYTKRELALIVYNGFFWYNLRNHPALFKFIDMSYIYTQEQLDHLIEVIKEENEDTYNIRGINEAINKSNKK